LLFLSLRRKLGTYINNHAVNLYDVDLLQGRVPGHLAENAAVAATNYQHLQTKKKIPKFEHLSSFNCYFFRNLL
jgi:hypothetical protein